MRATDQFHVGIVVPDFEETLSRLDALLGCRWGAEMRIEAPVRTPEGEQLVEFRFRYSTSHPLLEVIEQRPGTVWMPVPGSGLHHLGYWSDDLAADADALARAGYEPEVHGVDPSGTPIWAYHRAPSGPRVELVSRAMEPLLRPLYTPG